MHISFNCNSINDGKFKNRTTIRHNMQQGTVKYYSHKYCKILCTLISNRPLASSIEQLGPKIDYDLLLDNFLTDSLQVLESYVLGVRV